MKNRQPLHTKYYILHTPSLRDGYIAMTSAIIIAMLVMVIVFAVSMAGYFARSNILTSEFKDVSLALAEGCTEKALLKYAENTSYAGNKNITIGSRQCTILPIETSGSNKIIKTKAIVESVTSNIKVTFDGTDMTIISWEELSSL